MARALWLLLALAGSASALERPALSDPRFETVGDASSISDGVVSALAVDRSGFLWIGTAIGLVRFDGYQFLPVRMPESAATTFVRSLLAARDGRLWVGTDSDGLAVYDPQASAWRFFRHQPGRPDSFARGTVRALVEDLDGRIWAATIGGGLIRIDPASGRLQRFGTEQGLPDDRLQSLLVDREGSLWAGSWGGLARLPRGAERFVPAPGELALAGRVVGALLQDGRGRIWAGTQRGELLHADARGGDAQWVDRGGSPSGGVQMLIEMDGGELWLGRANGIELRERDSGRLLRLLRHSVARPWGPAGSDVRTLVKDLSGVLWVGSYGGGLQRHTADGRAIWVRRAEDDEDSVLGVVDLRSLVELPNGEIWAGSNDRGLAVLDPELRLRAEIRPQREGYRGGRAGGICVTPDGLVWVGSEDGVAVFESGSRRWLRNLALGKGRVRVMRALADGAVLAGTQDGAYLWRPGAPAFQRLGQLRGEPLKGDINALAQAADGRVWLGGERGLYTLAPGASTLQPLQVRTEAGVGSDRTVLGLLIDSRQRLWLDTPEGLLLLQGWQGDEARFSALHPRLGLGAQSFGANLLEDRSGRIWTHRGVYDPQRQRYEALGLADGVDIGTGWFRAYAGLRDGRLLFGGSRGLLVIDPARFQPWRFQPPVVGTRLRIRGVEQALARLQPALRLSPEERSFTLEFAALDLSQPGRNQYRYRLEGVDADWIRSDASERQASYGGLAPGPYRLQVQGSNRNGVWSPLALDLPIVVEPAWWQTWWVRGLGLLLALALLVAAVQLRTRLLRRRQVELEARVAERTLALETLSQALAEKSRALEESALTDPLTGLRNRRFVTERLDDDLRLAQRQHEEAARRGERAPEADICFFLIDLDHFKQVNDQHGHAAGDAVLVQMRARLQQVFRESDYLVRWGGEEFLVVARGSSRQAAPELAERARRAVAERPFELPQGRSLGRSCSIGFACFPPLPAEPRACGWALVVDLADAALYAAKREGRNRWVGVLGAGRLSAAELQQLLRRGPELDGGLELRRGP